MIQIDDDGCVLYLVHPQSATAEATAETGAPAAIAGTPGAAKTAGARVPDSIDGRGLACYTGLRDRCESPIRICGHRK
jgi:hypothetical protein